MNVVRNWRFQLFNILSIISTKNIYLFISLDNSWGRRQKKTNNLVDTYCMENHNEIPRKSLIIETFVCIHRGQLETIRHLEYNKILLIFWYVNTFKVMGK